MQVILLCQFAEYGANEGTQQDARQAEKNTAHRADGRADCSLRRGAELSRSQSPRDEVHQVGEHAHKCEYCKRTPAHVLEIFRPGCDHEAREQ